MNRKLSIFVLMIFLIGLLASFVTGQVFTVAKQPKGSGDSVQDLSARISNLEGQVAALQKQIKYLESKSSSRFLTIPSKEIFPGYHLPPGAEQHEVSGIKYWTIPIKVGK